MSKHTPLAITLIPTLVLTGALTGCARYTGQTDTPSKPPSTVASWVPPLAPRLSHIDLTDGHSVITDGAKALLEWDPQIDSDPVDTIKKARPMVSGNLFTKLGLDAQKVHWEVTIPGHTWERWHLAHARAHVILKDISASDNTPKDTQLDLYRAYDAIITVTDPQGRKLYKQRFIYRVQASKMGFWQLVMIQLEPLSAPEQ